MEPQPLEIVAGEGFTGWHALNDTVMGGRSQALCRVSARGLVLEGEVVAEGGGFVSCRSPLFSPPLDLSPFSGLRLDLSGEGRWFKLAVACADGLGGVTDLVPGGLRWVAAFPTDSSGTASVEIPFSRLRPSLRARPIESLPLGLPLRFDAARITRLQLLHSRVGDDGAENPGFRAGPLHLELHAIHAIP